MTEAGGPSTANKYAFAVKCILKQYNIDDTDPQNYSFFSAVWNIIG